MNQELKNLNFNNLLILDDNINFKEYNYKTYIVNKREHLLKGYCTKCEENEYNICPNDNNFKLTNISHGATSDDYLDATNQNNIDFSEWHNEGILFLLESPSINKGKLYRQIEFNKYSKRPSIEWYWLRNDNNEKLCYPKEFKGGSYGKLFNSIVFTFKLKNAYFTNLIKCGLNKNSGDEFKGIKDYNQKCINICFDNFLKKELEILNPKIIFCFGSAVYVNLIKQLKRYKLEKNFQIELLPHPARQRIGFSLRFYRHLYYSLIVENLYRTKVISKEEALIRFQEFLLIKQEH